MLARTHHYGILLLGLLSLSGLLDTAARGDEPDADRAFGYLKQVCDLGPRISGTEGMEKQQALIREHFTKLGAKVQSQEFDVQHPLTGRPVRMRNLIVSWQPEAAQRVLIACHYDTRPFPDQDPLPQNRQLPFLGANDGASGVGLLMELGHHMPDRKTPLGVDFVFFDGEELIYNPNRDKYFLGSEYFATQYRDNPPPFKYVAGVLIDMVGDKNLEIYIEKMSARYAPGVTDSLFRVAQELKIREFVPRKRHEVRDDHIPLNQIARIPSCDLIDFDYPYWHTRNDIPAACSGESLQKVGRVLLAWMDRYKGM